MQENILSKKLNLGLNFSTPSGGVTSPSLKGSMDCNDFFLFSFADYAYVYGTVQQVGQQHQSI